LLKGLKYKHSTTKISISFSLLVEINLLLELVIFGVIRF